MATIGGDQTENFMIFGFKIINCGQSSPHDWSTCPLAHVNEKARRRDPRVHDYLPDLCQTRARKLDCLYGDACPYAHNVYESWLHPLRYRTQMCRYGVNCVRPLCFFAHTPEEYRDPQIIGAWWQQQRLQQGFPPQIVAPPQQPLPPIVAAPQLGSFSLMGLSAGPAADLLMSSGMALGMGIGGGAMAVPTVPTVAIAAPQPRPGFVGSGMVSMNAAELQQLQMQLLLRQQQQQQQQQQATLLQVGTPPAPPPPLAGYASDGAALLQDGVSAGMQLQQQGGLQVLPTQQLTQAQQIQQQRVAVAAAAATAAPAPACVYQPAVVPVAAAAQHHIVRQASSLSGSGVSAASSPAHAALNTPDAAAAAAADLAASLGAMKLVAPAAAAGAALPATAALPLPAAPPAGGAAAGALDGAPSPQAPVVAASCS